MAAQIKQSFEEAWKQQSQFKNPRKDREENDFGVDGGSHASPGLDYGEGVFTSSEWFRDAWERSQNSRLGSRPRSLRPDSIATREK